jgi:hypothetical protein
LASLGSGYSAVATADKRSFDLSTGLLIVIVLIDLGLLTLGVRGRVH